MDVDGTVTEVEGKRAQEEKRLYKKRTFIRKASVATVGGSMVVLGVAMIPLLGQKWDVKMKKCLEEEIRRDTVVAVVIPAMEVCPPSWPWQR